MNKLLVFALLVLGVALLSAKWVWIENDEDVETLSAQTLDDDDANKAGELALGIARGFNNEMGTAYFDIAKLGKIGTGVAVANALVQTLGFLLRAALDRTRRGAYINIRNEVQYPLYLQGTHSWNMDRWDGQFPQSLYTWEEKQAYTETSYVFGGYYVDTNAEAKYSVYCPKNGRNVEFEIRIRSFDYYEIYVNDFWNPCYDIFITGKHNYVEYGEYTSWVYTRDIPESKVLKTARVPNFKLNLKVTVKPRQEGDDFKTVYLFADCGFLGDRMGVTASNPFIGSEFNDKVSSLIVPPGYALIAYSDANYQGQSRVYNADNSCIDMNDQISSYRLFKLQNGGLCEIK